MSVERLEWLELSLPAAPEKSTRAEDEAALCPQCGWPVPARADRCEQCGSASDGIGGGQLPESEITMPRPIIELEPPPESWFSQPRLDTPAIYDLRLQAERLRVTTGFDRLICLDDISVDHYEHQLEAALRALRDMRGRALLADEVGLGKTIEAGIVMKELIERGLAQSILILVPASLTWQWREEMVTKFHEEFTVLEKPGQLAESAEPEAGPCRWIISLDRARSAGWAKRLLAREYDLLIVDEAHKLKNQRTKAYRFVNAIRKRYVLMLTATPVHNNLMELYNLITILRPGHLGTRGAFRRNFIGSDSKTTSGRRAHRRTIYGRPDTLPYLRRNQAARQQERENGGPAGLTLVRRTESLADFKQTFLRKDDSGPLPTALAEIEQLLAGGYEIAEFEGIEWRDWYRRHQDFVCRLTLRPQPQPAKARPTRRQITPRNTAALRGLLREVMIRNRRSSVGVRFPRREAAVYHLNLSQPERQLYEGVTAYIRYQLHRLEGGPAAQTQARGLLRLTLMNLQRELCSTPQAVARTLTRLHANQPDERQLADYAGLARSVEQGRKVKATLDILDQYPGKFLIFTEFLPSVRVLRAVLKAAGHEVVIFHGGLPTQERFEVVRAFRRSARVMISTHSGGEGHNLQFCHQLINFDLPWNPMRIEQRIGRIHRLGQKNEVTIFNLSAIGTIEAYILELLARKIRMFELVIGELDLILGQLDDSRGLEHYLAEAWAGSQSEAELLDKIQSLEKVIDRAYTGYQKIQTYSNELSDLVDEES